MTATARGRPTKRTGARRAGTARAPSKQVRAKAASKRAPDRRRASSHTASRSGGAPAVLTGVVLALCVIGLVMVMSASSVVSQARYGNSWVYVQRQIMWTVLGLVAFYVATRFDYRKLQPLSLPLMAITAVLLVVVFVPGIGVSASGSARWVGVGPFTFQPSELAKLALAIFTAGLVVRRADAISDWRMVLRPALIVLVLVGVLIMKQPDMGTTIVISMIVGAVLFAGGVEMRQLLPVAGVATVAGTILAFAAPYRRARLLAFLDPFADAGNTGYQAVQSLIALGSGGLFGVGLGAGRQKWLFLPNAHTDFIFSVIGEELGLVGALIVVALLATFGVLGYRAAVRAPDRFGYLLAVAITTWIVGQGVINIGAAVGLLPITGVPLPFVSFGGSALLFTMAAAGVLVNISREGAGDRSRSRRAARPAPSAR